MMKAPGDTSGRSVVGEPARRGFPLEEYRDFHAELSSARRRLIDSMGDLQRSAPPGADEAAARQREGEPLLAAGLSWPDERFLMETSRDLLRAATMYEVLEDPEAEAVLGALGKVAFEDLLSAVAGGDADEVVALGKKGGVAADALLFLGENLARAVLKWHAEPLLPLIDEGVVARSGRCPICGNMPSFSLLEKDSGARVLLCRMCETTWRFKRMGCPFCGNEEPSSSRFFCVEDEPGYRVEVCDKCKRYVKQVDLRKVGVESVAVVDLDIASARLDILAMREGYR